MIKLENTITPSADQWATIILSMRNPLNSWHKSDSYHAVDCGKYGKIEMEGICKIEDRDCTGYECFEIGPNDLDLMKRLRNAGTDHRKFMRMVVVYVDITAPLYWWKEFDTYRTGVTPNPMDIEINSCSTMHKIHAKEFTLEDFSTDHLLDFSWNRLADTIEQLNYCRERFINYDSEEEKTRHPAMQYEKKDYWWQMIQLLPSSYNQKRTIMMNYEVLAHIYESRKNHKLDEWRDLCSWIESLPYSELITGNEKEKEK